MNNIFITGATGFLGSNLLRELLTKQGNNLYLLVRAKGDRSSPATKNTIIDKILPKSIQRKVSSRINIVIGDVTEDNLGLNKKSLTMLRNKINMIYHCAAIHEFGHNIDTIRKVNVKGTENILEMALDWKKRGHLENVNHISTAYVAGDYKGTFYENQADVSQKFNNTYERSKFEAEMAVLKYRKRGLPIDIYRPGIIIDSITPSTNVTSMALQFFAVFTSEIFEKIPANNNTKLNLITVDTASKAIYLISITKNRPLNRTYHIINPRPIRLINLLNAASVFFKCKKPKCISIARFRMHDFSSVKRRLIESFVPYLNQELSFDMRNASSILKRYAFAIPHINKEAMYKTFKHYQSFGLIPERSNYVVKK